MDKHSEPRLAYDEASTPHEMYSDCQAAGRNLHVPAPRATDRWVTTDAEFPEFAYRPATPVHVSETAARMAGALHLHFD